MTIQPRTSNLFFALFALASISLLSIACDDEGDSSNTTTSDTSGGDTSGSTTTDTSGSTATDTSGSTTTDTSGGDTSGVTTNTIVDIAIGNPDFSTLVTALTAADLVTTLQGDGPPSPSSPPPMQPSKNSPQKHSPTSSNPKIKTNSPRS